MKFLKPIFFAAICAALILNFTGCSTASSSSAAASSPSSSSAVSAPQEESSSSQSAENPETASAEPFVPSPDILPGVGEGSEAFKTAFSQNPIDQKYDKDYSRATSFSMMRQICDEASSSWKNMIDTAYRAAMEVLPEEGQARLKSEQETWAEEADGKLQEIQANAADSQDAALKAAQETVLFYRERAAALCYEKYQVDGTLPEFTSSPTTGDEPVG